MAEAFVAQNPDCVQPNHPAQIRLKSGSSRPTIYMTLAFINPVDKVSVTAIKLLDYPWSRFEDYRIELIGERATSSVTMNYGAVDGPRRDPRGKCDADG